MRIKEIRALGSDELRKQLDESYQELLSLRFRLATKQLTNQEQIRKVRKKVARMKTVLRDRELAER